MFPGFSRLVEDGVVVGLNMPTGSNPALSRTIGVLMKLEYQSAVLRRQSGERLRPSVFLCDEYQAFATVGESDPAGDERFFAMSRQKRCVPIVATQTVSSLKSALSGSDAAVKTLLAQFRTKIFLGTTDPDTARYGEDVCGKVERLKQQYSVGESGQDSRLSLIDGRAVSTQASVHVNKSLTPQLWPIFPAQKFLDLPNCVAIACVYDGQKPLPPSYLYLKPHYLPIQKTWFEQEYDGEV
jgi:hypothetical protein